jgi:hypothetical protein
VKNGGSTWRIHHISQCARNSPRHETAGRASEKRVGLERAPEAGAAKPRGRASIKCLTDRLVGCNASSAFLVGPPRPLAAKRTGYSERELSGSVMPSFLNYCRSHQQDSSEVLRQQSGRLPNDLFIRAPSTAFMKLMTIANSHKRSCSCFAVSRCNKGFQ